MQFSHLWIMILKGGEDSPYKAMGRSSTNARYDVISEFFSPRKC